MNDTGPVIKCHLWSGNDAQNKQIAPIRIPAATAIPRLKYRPDGGGRVIRIKSPDAALK